MPVRRNAEPQVVQHVWDGFRFCAVHSANIDIAKLSKYMQKICQINSQQAESFIRLVLKDKLLLPNKKNARSSNKAAESAVEYYRLPNDDESAVSLIFMHL